MRHRHGSSFRRLCLSLTAVCVAVIAAGAGTPRIAGALDQAPQKPEPAAVDAGHFTDGHNNADGHHAEVECAEPTGATADGEYVPCTHGGDPVPRGFEIEREVPARDAVANVNAVLAAP